MEIRSISNQTNSVNFGRKLLPAEMKVYKKTIRQGLKALNKELGIIVHNSTVPAKASLNTGVGSLLSATALATFVPLLSLHGITKIQQEPDNLRRSWTPSPYAPLTTGKNIYMIPLEKLTTDEYGKILPTEVLNTIANNRPNKDTNDMDYNYVVNNYDNALKIAYLNFSEKANSTIQKDAKIAKLAEEFIEFKSKNVEELEPQAIFEVLANEHNTDDWKTWNKVDRNLYNIKTPQQGQAAVERFNEIKKVHAKDIDFYYFKQMLVEREISKASKEIAQKDISIIGDSPVAFTPVEEWQNQDLFMKDFALGCPPDYFSKNGQRWGFSVLKPETIFNPDGSLGEGGKLMQKRYEKMFKSSSGGARIDHIIGLIDPFVYSTKEPKMTKENSGRLYSSPNHKILGKYAKTSDEEYAAILTKIVIPAAEKYALTKDDIICEDLGEVTDPVKRVMENLGLSGIGVTQFDYRVADAEPDRVIMLGSHDNPSFIEFTRGLFKDAENSKNAKKRLKYKIKNLTEDTIQPNECSWSYKRGLKKNQQKFMKAAFTELFTSPAKRVQVFFTDFFGIDKTYNFPGKTEGCWTLRMPNNIEEFYYNNLKAGKGFNIPEILARAIRCEGEFFSEKHKDLLVELDKFAEILKS